MIFSLKKYLKLYWAFFRASVIADLEYRANVIMRIITDVFWNIAQIATFEVLFRQTNNLGGWQIEQMRVFLGVLFIVDAIYMVLIHDNMEHFSDKVRKGELDLLLAKPVNSQFIMSLQRACTPAVGNFFIASAWLTWALRGLPDGFSLERMLWFLVLIPCGVIIVYSGRFFFASLSMFFTRAENMQYLWYQVYRLGMRPDVIYKPWMKYVVMSVLPAALIASIPARAILEPPNRWLFIWSIFLAGFCFWLTTRHWRRALRAYASASS